MMPDACQAKNLGSSGIIFGISRLFLGNKKSLKQDKKVLVRKKEKALPTSNFWKCASGAVAACAEIGNFWHFLPVLVSLKFYSHEFAFFYDQKNTTTSQDKNPAYGRH